MKKKITQNQCIQDVTLIIPTFNRPQLLHRLLNYYAAKKTPMHFLVLDSSEKPARELNEMACRVLGERSHYIHFPAAMSVADKLLAGLKLVKTPFCAFCADDDLVFIEGIVQAVVFLQEHPDYVCADGIYLNFYQGENKVHLSVEYATKGVNAEDPGARIFKLCQKYESLFYGVFKTEHALAIFSGVSRNSSLHYQELFQATAALLIGKSQRLPGFYAARQSCPPADQGRDKWQTYYWFADNSQEFLEHYQIYREELWNFYQTINSRYSREEFFQITDLAHAMYFSMGCPPAYFHAVLQNKWPEEAFKKPHIYHDNICNQLKSKRRIWQETAVVRSLTWLGKVVASFYSIRDTKTLNKMIRASTKNSWHCELNRDLRWLASVGIFREAYHELCCYLSTATEPVLSREE